MFCEVMSTEYYGSRIMPDEYFAMMQHGHDPDQIVTVAAHANTMIAQCAAHVILSETQELCRSKGRGVVVEFIFSLSDMLMERRHELVYASRRWMHKLCRGRSATLKKVDEYLSRYDPPTQVPFFTHITDVKGVRALCLGMVQRPSEETQSIQPFRDTNLVCLRSIDPFRCDNCNKIFPYKLRMCGTCRQAFYCSEECQKESWPAHKKTHWKK